MTRTEMLKQAEKCVCGKREDDYGSPENNFAVIGELWSVYLGREITPTDVAAMMALLKLARIKSSPKVEDSWVDLAGYAACGCELAGGEEKAPVKSKIDALPPHPLEPKRKKVCERMHDICHNCPLSSARNGTFLSCKSYMEQYPTYASITISKILGDDE